MILFDWLAELERVEKAATPGPWKRVIQGKILHHDSLVCTTNEFGNSTEERHYGNANLITQSRNAFSKLLQIIRLQDEALKSYAGQGKYSEWEDNLKYITFDKFGGLCSETMGAWEAQQTRAAVQKIVGGEVSKLITEGAEINQEIQNNFLFKSSRTSESLLDAVVNDVCNEFNSATTKFPKFNTAHEGYAVLLEEVDELWDHVKVKQSKRDINAMREEAIQISAMAMRFVVDICNEETGRK